MIPPHELHRIWIEHADRLCLIAKTLGGPEDTVQDAFVQLAKEDRLPDPLRPWLIRVVRNGVFQWHRRSKRRRERERVASEAAWLRHTTASEDLLDACEVTEQLQELDDETREFIVLHIWGQLSFEEISSLTGASRSTAHRRYQAGLAQLKKHFEPPIPPTSETQRREVSTRDAQSS